MAPTVSLAAAGDSQPNPYDKLLRTVTINGQPHAYYDISQINPDAYATLPYSIRVLLESAVRNCDEFQVKRTDVENILAWQQSTKGPTEIEIPFRPARVILQDFTGVPAVVDLAAMRDKVKELGGDPNKINPICPADLVIDHSVQVDVSGVIDALKRNEEIEFERNRERFMFLKWGAKAFRNMIIVPPGSGIVHQVNLEYLARVVFNTDADGKQNLLYPDSVVGTDSHTTMINGLGVLGWGVGGIEAEAVMLGQTISMVLPSVVGYRLTGHLSKWATSTDLVLTITKHLRQHGVVGKFVEFYGPSLAELSIADRATVANMCPEYGATCAYFPVDESSLDYLKQTNRSEEQLSYIRTYLQAVGLFRNDFADAGEDPTFTEVIELDLGTVVPSISGPKRPQDKVAVDNVKTEFTAALSNKVGFNGFGISADKIAAAAPVAFNGKPYQLKHGSVVIAAITSCTNTSNPSVMLAAGMLARKACDLGLVVPEYVKTSLSPGSGVVTHYLKSSGVMPYLEQLGFQVVGYGCMTCIGNSGPLPDEIVEAIEKNELVVAGVLSGNRNFEGRVHPNTRANYLASPPLVIAYALAGTVLIDFNTEPLGHDQSGKPVFLRDIWPTRDEVRTVEAQYVVPSMFADCYSKIQRGSDGWVNLTVPDTELYPWDQTSTYIKAPPFFDGLTRNLVAREPIANAHVLLHVGDSVTTDHISPAGSIARNSAAARYLTEKNLQPRDFNSYGARRGNDDIMARGTFANIRLVNRLMNGKTGPYTVHVPSQQTMDVYDAACEYRRAGHPVIILAGKDYGCGSSRDWAAKGPFLLGVRAVIAESYERIHRSNLVGMGIVPLQYMPGESSATLGLTGHEQFTIHLPANPSPKQTIAVETSTGQKFSVIVRFDTEVELTYYKNGGILNYMIRKMF